MDEPAAARSCKVRRVAADATHVDWAAVVGGLDRASPHVEILKSDGPPERLSLVLACDVDGQFPHQSERGQVVLKREPVVGAIGWLRSVLGCTRADRHWWGAMALARAGVPTAPCLALLSERASGTGTTGATWLVMERLAGPTLLQLLRHWHAGTGAGLVAGMGAGSDVTAPDGRDQHAVARVVGGTLARLVNAGMTNRDAKPSNWIIMPSGENSQARARAQPTAAMLDCVGLRRANARRVVAMLASLVIEPTGVGVPVRRTLLMRGLVQFAGVLGVGGSASAGARSETSSGSRLERHAMWRSVQREVVQHLTRSGGGVPRVSPLGQRAFGSA